MAHFAKLDSNNVVIDIIVVANEDILDEEGNESEEIGIQFCRDVLGQDTNWAQTSYNNNFRGNYAKIGDVFRPDLDRFINPRPFDSWSYDEIQNKWLPPFDHPNDASILKRYHWNEANVSWDFKEYDLNGNIINVGTVTP